MVLFFAGDDPAPRLETTLSMRKRNYILTDRSSRTARRKKLLVAACLLFALYLLASFIFGEMGLIKYYRMKAQYDSLTEETARLKRDNAGLRKDVYSLKNDPASVERIARDKLGLARKGEIVYYYDDINPKSEMTNPK